MTDKIRLAVAVRVFQSMQKKQALLASKLKHDTGLPLAFAMLVRGIYELIRHGETAGQIREVSELALDLYAGSIVDMPSEGEALEIASHHSEKVAEVLNRAEDERKRG